MINRGSILVRFGLLALGLAVGLTGVALSGDGGGFPQAVSPTGTGQFIALSADRTHLVNTFTNKPAFITGDTAYALVVRYCSFPPGLG